VKGKRTGITFIDNTSIKAYRNQIINSNSIFKDVAKRGKTLIGWFFGLKLDLVVNDREEIINFLLSQGNIDDKNNNILGKLSDTAF